MTNFRVASFGNIKSNRVALTFDDGPNPYSTEKILKILKKFNIQATFFVLGKRCLEHPEILKELDRQGHLIGNHTFFHNRGDFEKCEQEIFRIISKSTKYVRPPFYDLTFCYEEFEYLKEKHIIIGDVDSKDYLNISSTDVLENVLAQTKNGSIVDLHDGSEIDGDLEKRASKTIDALPKIIKELQKKHFDLVKLDEMELEFNTRNLYNDIVLW